LSVLPLIAYASDSAVVDPAEERRRMAVCHDSSYDQGYTVFKFFNNMYELKYSHLSKPTYNYSLEKGRAIRKKLAEANGLTRKEARSKIWEQRGCSEYLQPNKSLNSVSDTSSSGL